MTMVATARRRVMSVIMDRWGSVRKSCLVNTNDTPQNMVLIDNAIYTIERFITRCKNTNFFLNVYTFLNNVSL